MAQLWVNVEDVDPKLNQRLAIALLLQTRSLLLNFHMVDDRCLRVGQCLRCWFNIQTMVGELSETAPTADVIVDPVLSIADVGNADLIISLP